MASARSRCLIICIYTRSDSQKSNILCHEFTSYRCFRDTWNQRRVAIAVRMRRRRVSPGKGGEPCFPWPPASSFPILAMMRFAVKRRWTSRCITTASSEFATNLPPVLDTTCPVAHVVTMHITFPRILRR